MSTFYGRYPGQGAGGGGSSFALGDFGNTPTAKGAIFTGGVLYMEPFDATNPGMVKPSGGGSSNFLRADGTWATPAGTGVTSVSVTTANGFAGSSSGGATPALTLSTTISGLLKGNGTAISAAGSADLPTITLTGDATGSGSGGSVATSVVKVNGAIVPISKTVVGTNASGQIIDASSATLSNNTTGTAANITATSNSTLTTLSALLLPTSQLSGTISNSQLANMAAHTFKGNNTGSSAAPLDLTATQLTAELNQFTSSLQGVVPGSGGGTTNFLRADGTWQQPPTTAVGYGFTSINTTNGSVTVTSGNTLFYPFPTIQGSDTYTINSGAYMIYGGIMTVSGTLIVNGNVYAVA